ncbi:MAG TPA: hypothetical protein VE714_02380, partial [Gemmatimonadales bacterium]|nr:hypothetical protein [Gemmatimonadales bacterium]
MRKHYFTALVLAAPFVLSTGLAAQDTTQSQQKQGQNRDSTSQQYQQGNSFSQSGQAQGSDQQVVLQLHQINQM